MTKVGLVAFIYLPVMFAVAIPLGLAREEKGVAAFAGFVGYAALNLHQLLPRWPMSSVTGRRRRPTGEIHPRHQLHRYRYSGAIIVG